MLNYIVMSGKSWSMDLILNQPADITTRYVHGSGVGAKPLAIRRRLLRHAVVKSTTHCDCLDTLAKK
jgi:hypothetical protein